MGNRRIALLVALTLSITALVAAPAMAAAPPNDTSAGAVVIDPTGLPFNDVVSTVEATTDVEDAQANELCGFESTNASVWYRFTPDTTDVYRLDVSASDYEVGGIVATGSPGSLNLVNCSTGFVDFFAESGTEHWILVFDAVGGNGGTLNLTLDAAPPPPPPPEISVSVEGATFDRTGGATVFGTYTCSSDFLIEVGLFGTLTQSVGRFTVQGSFGFVTAPGPCLGELTPWSAEVFSATGKFRGGWARVNVNAVACEIFGVCGSASAQAQVKLRKA